MNADAVRDLLILGGGPAGTAAALHGAAKGLRITLLERSTFPRDRPGESLHPGIEPLFEMLGVRELVESAGFARTTGIHRVTAGHHEFEPFGHDPDGAWRGFQAWRADLDHLLLREARRRGVEILQPVTATGLLRERDQVAGVTLPGSSLRARCILDASGRGRWLSRQLGLPWSAQSPQLVAWYGYQRAPSDGDHWREPSFETSRDGWCWSCQVKPSLMHWTRLCLHGGRTWHGRRIPDHLAKLPTVRKPRGVDVTWRIAARVAGPGFFLTGDAASVLDPGASHGVLKALVTGIRAAESAAANRNAPGDEASIVKMYDQWLRDWHHQDVSRLAEVYRGLAPAIPWLFAGCRQRAIAISGRVFNGNASPRRQHSLPISKPLDVFS